LRFVLLIFQHSEMIADNVEMFLPGSLWVATATPEPATPPLTESAYLPAAQCVERSLIENIHQTNYSYPAVSDRTQSWEP
jgi:hypothetical protein